MLEKIKNAIFAKYKKEDIYWAFLSVFDENNKMLIIKAGEFMDKAFYTDKVLDSLLDTLYHWLVENHKNVSYIVVDIVINPEEIMDVSKINEIPLNQFWIAVIAGDKYGVMLPNTAWVANTLQALQLIKQKDKLGWNAKIVKFQTDRILVR